MLHYFIAKSRRLRRDEDGQVAMLVGLALVPLMLVTGLIIDGGLAFFEERGARNAADAAALVGAKQIFDGLDTTNYSASPLVDSPCGDPLTRVGPPAFDAACDLAEAHGYLDTGASTDVMVSIPPGVPAIAAHQSVSNVQVKVRQSRETAFMRLGGIPTVTVSVQAVAGQMTGEPSGVLYALSDDACPGFDRSGSGNLAVFGGSLLVNAECGPPPQGAMGKSGSGGICLDAHLDLVDHNDNDDGDGFYREAGEVNPPPGGTYDFNDCWSDGVDDGDINIDGVASCPMSGCNSQPDLIASSNSGEVDDPLKNLPGPYPDTTLPGNAFTFCDYDSDGDADGANALGLLDGDPRTTHTKTFAIDAGLTGGCGAVFTFIPTSINNVLAAIDSTTPSQYDACNAPDDPGGLLGSLDLIPSLLPGIYWGGIEASNCSVRFEPGVYILAGRGGSNDESLRLHLTGGPDVINNGTLGGGAGLLFLVTRDDDATAGSREAPGDVSLVNSSASGVLSLTAGTPPTCPTTGPTFSGLLLFVYRDAPLVPSTGGGAANGGQTFVNGGGALTAFQGSLYHKNGRFRANGSFQLLDAEIVYNVLDFQIQGDVIVTAQCGGPAAPFIALLE